MKIKLLCKNINDHSWQINGNSCKKQKTNIVPSYS